MHNGNVFGGGQYRILQPAAIMRGSGVALAQAHPTILDDHVLTAMAPDVVVLQFQQTDTQIEAMKRYRKAVPDAFMVYEIDDIFWRVPDESIHKAGVPADVKERIERAAKICNAITVTTPYLADQMKRLTRNVDVRIIPNELPQWFINAAREGRRNAKSTDSSTKPRVGWVGGVGHSGDLSILPDVMKRLGDTVHWVFMGWAPGQKHGQQINMDWVPEGVTAEFTPGVDFKDYPAAMGALRLDLALAPLQDNMFNRCKSDLRILEYGAAGFPVLASDIVTYADCPVIARAPWNAQAWAEEIVSLLGDKERRDSLAEKLHLWVCETRCMDRNIADRVQKLLPRNATRFEPAKNFNAADTQGVSVVCTTSWTGGMDIETFSSVEAARIAHPHNHVLYIRDNTKLTSRQLMTFVGSLGNPNVASVSALTNDSQYPDPQRFVDMTDSVAADLDECSILLDAKPVILPFPTGPAVLMSDAALSRFGLPDITSFGGDLEGAMMDWGARCAELGLKHILTANAFVHTKRRVTRPKEMTEHFVNKVSAWMPMLTPTLQNFVRSNPLGPVREELELAHNRHFYRKPQHDSSYMSWSRINDTPGTADFAAMDAMTAEWESNCGGGDNLPRINIVMPLYNTPHEFLMEAIESVLAQNYPYWRLLIVDDASTDSEVRKIAEGFWSREPRIEYKKRPENGHICVASNDALDMAEHGWVVFLDHDDRLPKHALWMLAHTILTNPDAQFIYSDSDKIQPVDPNKSVEHPDRNFPYFSPDFNYELLLAQNYVTHMACYRLEGIRAVDNLRPGYEGSQDWDLALRYITHTCGNPPDKSKIVHIQHVLYHWRMSPDSVSMNINSKPYALAAGQRAVIDHLAQTGQRAIVGPNPVFPAYTMVRWLNEQDAPSVTIIIPTKDNKDVLARCLNAVLQKTMYPNFNIVIVDNGSKQKDTLTFLNTVQTHKQVTVKRRPGPFNFAAINNEAVRDTTAQFVCLLNDDTEPLEPSWLSDMVALANRPGVGAVGAKLLYPSGHVQQNGIIIDWSAPPGGKCLHAFQRMGQNDTGQAARNLITQEWVAVTGACLVVRRSLYENVNGMDADAFPIDYNDVDFCLRLHAAGYRNIVSAQALVFHHEGVTKRQHLIGYKRETMIAAEERLMARHKRIVDGGWNKNLMFHPHLTQGTQNAVPKPWTIDRKRVLLVNGTMVDALAQWDAGHLPLCVTLNGHNCHLTFPHATHVQPIDIRGSADNFIGLALMLDIQKVIFCGVGNGTVGAIGYFRKVAETIQTEVALTKEADIRDPHVPADVFDLGIGALMNQKQAA
jgi:GT2 family glycosyltransferase/glycosyltransferase involved in cell wall biosynthesis